MYVEESCAEPQQREMGCLCPGQPSCVCSSTFFGKIGRGGMVIFHAIAHAEGIIIPFELGHVRNHRYIHSPTLHARDGRGSEAS